MKDIKEILKIGIPIMLGQACVIILAFADNIMIGRHSVDELAAASFVNNVLNLFILMEMGFATGMTPMIGAFHGNRDIKGIGLTLKNGLYVNGLIGLASLFLLVAIYFHLDKFGQAPELLQFIRPYFAIISISTFFQLGFNTLKQFTDGLQHPVVSMAFLMVGNMVNIFLNWVMIYGNLGCPEMGLEGAGISTLLSRILILATFALYIFNSRKFRCYTDTFKEAILSKARMKHIFCMGYPISIQMGLETSTFSFSAIMAGWLGVMELAAHQVVSTISLLFFLMLQGLSFAISILVSNSYGKGDCNSIRRYTNKGYCMMLAISATFSILLYTFKYEAAGIFTDSENVATISVSLFFILFAYQFGDGLQLCFANVLRGLQDVKPILSAAFVSYYVIAIPCAYLLGFTAGWGIQGVWLGFPIGLTLAGTFYYLRYRNDMKRMETQRSDITTPYNPSNGIIE